MRIYGAAPSLLERVVPSRAGGSVSGLDEDFDMMGYALPPGTIVSTQAYGFSSPILYCIHHACDHGLPRIMG